MNNENPLMNLHKIPFVRRGQNGWRGVHLLRFDPSGVVKVTAGVGLLTDYN